MINRISYEGIGEVLATFPAAADVADGGVVKLNASGEAAACGAGERFFGVATHARTGAAGVQVAGFAEAKCDGGVSCGWVKLVGDGKGGVKKDTGSVGDEYLVVAAGEGTVTFKL